jgi:hypothetical protein
MDASHLLLVQRDASHLLLVQRLKRWRRGKTQDLAKKYIHDTLNIAYEQYGTSFFYDTDKLLARGHTLDLFDYF